MKDKQHSYISLWKRGISTQHKQMYVQYRSVSSTHNNFFVQTVYRNNVYIWKHEITDVQPKVMYL